MKAQRDKSRSAARFKLDLPVPRATLIEYVEQLQAARARGQITMALSANLSLLLVQIIDQLPPKRDKRVNLQVWLIAMLARALKTRPARRAVKAAIRTLAPGREDDEDFCEYVGRVHRRLVAGANAARGQLLDPPADVIAMARQEIRKN